MLNELVSERERIERYWDTRSKEGELNHAVFLFAARCLAEGDIEALRQIGFMPEDIPVLDQLRVSDLQAVSASQAHVLNISVDRAALQRLLDGIHRRRTRERLKHELLRLDAPLPMMTTLFGMSTREYTAIRDHIGVTGGVGRPKSQIDDEESAIWRLWVLLADAARPQRLRQDDLWLIVGREHPDKLRDAWFAIHRWGQDPVTLQAFEADRLRTPDSIVMREEAVLRAQHVVSPIEIAAAPIGTVPGEPDQTPGTIRH